MQLYTVYLYLETAQFSFDVFVLVGFVCLFGINKFNVYGSVDRKYIPIYIQQDETLHILFISGNCSTCFG